MPLATDLYVIIDYWYAKFQDNADQLETTPDLIFYGDQDRFQGYPAICLEPDGEAQALDYTGRRTNIEFRFYAVVYHGEVQDPQTNRRAADVLGAKVKDFLNSHYNMEGLVVFGYVMELASGYATKAGTPVRATRLTYWARSQEQLAMTP
jgi:hypothetical protein